MKKNKTTKTSKTKNKIIPPPQEQLALDDYYDEEDDEGDDADAFFENLTNQQRRKKEEEEEQQPVMVSRLGWYGDIESEVRDVVRLLRDNGFNTTSSNGHEMTVEMDLGNLNEAERLAKLLSDNEYETFCIECDILVPSKGLWSRHATLHFKRSECIAY